MIQNLIDRICRLFSYLMVFCLAAMVVMVFGNVVLRYGFNSGITASEPAGGQEVLLRGRPPADALHVLAHGRGRLEADGHQLRHRVQVGVDMLFEMIPPYLEFFGFAATTPERLRAVARLRY